MASCWRFCARQASGSCGLVQVLAPAGVSGLARVWHECSTSCSRSWTKLSPTLSRCQLNTYESRSSVAVVLQTLLNVASVVHHQRCSAVSQRVIQRQPVTQRQPASQSASQPASQSVTQQLGMYLMWKPSFCVGLSWSSELYRQKSTEQ